MSVSDDQVNWYDVVSQLIELFALAKQNCFISSLRKLANNFPHFRNPPFIFAPINTMTVVPLAHDELMKRLSVLHKLGGCDVYKWPSRLLLCRGFAGIKALPSCSPPELTRITIEMHLTLFAILLVFLGVSNVVAPLTPIPEDAEHAIIPVYNVVASDIYRPLANKYADVPAGQVQHIGHFPKTLRVISLLFFSYSLA